MKSLQPFFAPIFLSLLILTACSNDDDAPQAEPTPEELLTETGKWYIEYTENEIMDDCDKRTSYEFKGNTNTEIWYYTDDTSSDCQIAYTKTNNFEWLSDTQLRVLDDDYPYELTIKSISETEMTADFYSIVNDETKEMVFDKNPGEG